MRVTVRCFAVARELAGFAERTLEMPDGATAGDVLDRIVADAPLLAPHVGRMALAVNLEYVSGPCVMRDGDEVALIPPVSGGNADGPSTGPENVPRGTIP